MWSTIKGALFEGEEQKPQQEQVQSKPATQNQVTGAATAQTNDKFVNALKTAIKSRQTAFTALMTAAEKLTNIIPDPNTRLKAAYATIQGEGRGAKEILGAIEVHQADLESQKLSFNKQSEDALRLTIGGKQSELDSIDPSIQIAQNQIQALTQQIQTLNETIAQRTARKAELAADIANDSATFAVAKQQFETALTIVKAELDGQKAVIVSALS